MAAEEEGYRLYQDLAEWWPLISPPEEYAEETAFAECRPGGIAVFVPDHITENFEAGTGYGGIDGPDGRGARYLDWAYDPDPGDTWTLTQYAFLLRDAGGQVRVVHETHRLGL